MGKPNSNLGASRYDKLKNKARAEKKPFMSLVDQYAFTGLLRRLSKSEWGEFFSLKGGMMMLVLTGECSRPTKDVDLDGPRALSLEELKAAIRAIATTDIGEEDDGLTFDLEEIKVDKDRTAEGLISGAKVTLPARLGKASLGLKIDVGFENVVTPELRPASVPAQLKDEGDVRVMMYPIETSIAEKFRAMVYYGRANSRLKDFYDIQMFRTLAEMDGEVVAMALERSCDKFGFKVPPLEDIPALDTDPENAEVFRKQWLSFAKKNGLETSSFEQCQIEIREFLGPVIDFMNGQGPCPGKWHPESGWSQEASLELAM